MNTRKTLLPLCLVMTLALVFLTAGCSSYPTKFGILHGGHVQREHGKPMEGGYYEDFDPEAASIEVTPVEDTNQVKTQHVLIATVKDADGNPLPSRRVEWIIAEGSVGSFVEVDESGWYNTRGHKIDNKYAVTHTNLNDHVITRGNSDPADDIHLKKGQTWAVITSPVEGDTNLVVYAPAVFNWDKHKVFAVKHWSDLDVDWPAPATNTIGTPHDLNVMVMKASDGSPIADATVVFNISDGPDAMFTQTKTKTATAKTDGAGRAHVQLVQARPVEGVNTIQMQVTTPADTECCIPVARMTGKTTKTWVGPRIDIAKSAPARAGLNDMFNYQMTVTNPGKAPATNVQVKDTLPAGIEYVSSSPSAQVSGQNLSWSLGTLEPGRNRDISVRVKATRTGTFENCADVMADHNLKDRDCATTVVTAPSLQLEKSGPAEVLLCDPIEYTVVVRNTGDGPANNVTVTDRLPNGLTTETGQSVATFNAGTLAPGQAKTASYVAKASKTGTYTNTAMAKADGGLEAEASHRVTVRQPVLVLTKTGPEMRYVNRSTTYELTVTNKGDGVARDTVLTDQVPAGVTFESASDNGRLAGGQVTWNLGDLQPNASRTVSMTIMPTQRGTIRNRATARAYCADASAEATTAIEGIPAILLEVIDLEDPIEIGNNETYEIVVTNQGSADGTNIVITATLPPQQEYVSSAGPTNAVVDGKTVTFRPLPNLAPKAKATYRVIVRGTGTGDVRFRVELTSDQMTSPAMETESTHIYE